MRLKPSALAFAVFASGCAGGAAPSTPPEPARSTPPADPPATSAAPLPSAAAPATAVRDGATDAGAAEVSVDAQADVKAANGFTARLYGRVKKAPGNVMISGTSVRHALEIAFLGARGETAFREDVHPRTGSRLIRRHGPGVDPRSPCLSFRASRLYRVELSP